MTTTFDPLVATDSPGAETSVPHRPLSADIDRPTWADFRNLEERVQQRANRGDTWTVSIFVFAVIAVFFGVVGIGLGARAVNESKHNVRATTATSPKPSVALPALAVSPVAVTLSDMRVQPSATSIAAGKVTLEVTNTGMIQHELLVFRSDLAPADYPMTDGNISEDGPGITKVSDGENLSPGASQTRVVDFTQPGTYMLVCNLPGHFKMGMYSIVTVK